MPEFQDRTQTADSSRDTLPDQPAADPARVQTPNASAVAPHAQAQAWGAPVDPMVLAPNPQGAAFAQDQQAKGLGGPAPAALPSAAPKPSSPAPSETGAAPGFRCWRPATTTDETATTKGCPKTCLQAHPLFSG